MWLLAAIELIVAAQAVDLAAGGRAESWARARRPRYAVVRELGRHRWSRTARSAPTSSGSPLEPLVGGELLERVRAAVTCA